MNKVYSIWNDFCCSFLEMAIFTMLFRRRPTLWNSTLKKTTLFWRCLILFISTLKYRAFFDVVNSNVETHNVVSTLIWRCPASGRHSNQKATLRICHQPELATLFMTLIKYLISQTGALQILASKSSKQNLN